MKFELKDIYETNKIGRLMITKENSQTRFQYEIWFEYTRQTIIDLKEGSLLAVKNFATDQEITHRSILEIISLKPIHYALGENVEGYPGFVMEAAKNLAIDWISQESESNEDTTIILCQATPIGLEIVEKSDGIFLNEEESIPMIGSDVRVIVK